MEELKLVAEDRRFYVTRFFHAAAFYLAILALGVKLIVNAATQLELYAFFFVFQVFNVLAFFLTCQFKKIVYHSLEQEQKLAKQLYFKGPAELMWGAYAAVVIAVVSVIGFAMLTHARCSTLASAGKGCYCLVTNISSFFAQKN